MMHYILFYDVVPDYVERRAAFREAHLALGQAAAARGELVLGGALADPVDGAVLLFQGPGRCEVVSRTADCIALRSGARRLYLLRDSTGAYEAVVPSFDVPNRATALAALQAAGCTLVPIGPHAPGEHYVRDPHGVLFDVIERGAELPA